MASILPKEPEACSGRLGNLPEAPRPEPALLAAVLLPEEPHPYPRAVLGFHDTLNSMKLLPKIPFCTWAKKSSVVLQEQT